MRRCPRLAGPLFVVVGYAPALLAQQYCVSGAITSVANCNSCNFHVGDAVAMTFTVAPTSETCTGTVGCTAHSSFSATIGGRNWTELDPNTYGNLITISSAPLGTSTTVTISGEGNLSPLPNPEPSDFNLIASLTIAGIPGNLVSGGALPAALPSPEAVASSHGFVAFSATTVGGGGAPTFSYTGQTCAAPPGTQTSEMAKPLGYCPTCEYNATHPGIFGAGEPIEVATGNVFESVTDYTTVGPNPLSFTRSYNSMAVSANPNTFATSLGKNWRSNYDRYLNIVSNTSVSAERADGQVVTFTLTGGTWTPDSDVDMTLTNAGTTWTFTDHYDTVETYTVAGNEGTLNKIVARNGYSQTLNYSGGQLKTVTDSYNRSLAFTYAGGLLQTVGTPDGLTFSYGFTAVTGGNILTSVGYSTTPATNITYQYSNLSFPFALTGLIDENGQLFSSWAYDTNGRGVSSQQGGAIGASLTTLTYNSDGTTTVTNALGVADTYTFQTLQGVSKVTQISRAATATTAAATRTFGYDANGFLNGASDWNGNQATYVNDAHGDPTAINEAVGSPVARTTTISYDPVFIHLPHQIITPGLTSTFVYDGSGNPHTRTDLDTTTNTVPYSTSGQSRVTTWTWTATGQEMSVQLPRTDVIAKTSYSYTGGTLTQIQDALGHQTNITSSTGGGLPLTVVDVNGLTTTLAYDARLNLHTSILHAGAGNLTTTWTHDAANNLTGVQLPDNSALTYAHDAAHRLTRVTDLFGDSINYTLDALGDRTLMEVTKGLGRVGRAVALDDGKEALPAAVEEIIRRPVRPGPLANVTEKHSATFDALGRVLNDIGGTGQTTVYTWDANGNPKTVTPPAPSGVVTYTYDQLNRLATRTDPAPGGTTVTKYDAHDRVLSVKDANGNTTSYVYDGFGDRTQVVSPDSGTSVMKYDPDRNLTQTVKPGPLAANMTYDADDRPLTTTYPSDATLNVSRNWDEATGHGFGVGRLTNWTDQTGSGALTYDERGNVMTESRVVTGVGTLNTATSFDAANRVSGIIYPSGTAVVYARDAMGRVTAVTAQPSGAASPSNVVTGVAYEPFGPETALTFGSGIAGAYRYDLDYRATARIDTGASPIQNLAYGYYPNNSVNTITDAVNTANTQTLTYDTLDRLSTATSGAGGYGSYAFTWDANSNIKTQVINGATTTYTLAAGTNRLAQWVTGGTTEIVSSTPAENINTLKIGATTEETLTYNQANQVADAATTTTSATYKYDLAGQRLEKSVSGSNPILYQYSRRGGELLAENDLHNGQTADYIYLDPGRNSRPIGEVNPTTGTVYFMHTDRLGTPQKVTDSTQTVVWRASYNPFGDTRLGAVSGTLTTQSLRLPGQYFDPETGYSHNGARDYAGVFTRYIQSDPIGLAGGTNTYQYVSGNPFKWVDRWGLQENEVGPPIQIPIPPANRAPGLPSPLPLSVRQLINTVQPSKSEDSDYYNDLNDLASDIAEQQNGLIEVRKALNEIAQEKQRNAYDSLLKEIDAAKVCTKYNPTGTSTLTNSAFLCGPNGCQTSLQGQLNASYSSIDDDLLRKLSPVP